MPESLSSYERITRALRHQEADRVPLTETFVWPDTYQRWKKEGFPADGDVVEYFALDRITCGGGFDSSLKAVFPHIVFEETDEYIIDQNNFGVKVKYFKNRFVTHVELDHAVKEYADWKKIKHHLAVSDDRLVDTGAERTKARQRGDFVALNIVDPFWFSFVMLGMENLMIQMAGDPEFIEDIYATYTDLMMAMVEKIAATGTPWDCVWFFSDMAYRNGPMFSPAFYDRYLLPHHKRMSDYCRGRGKFLFLHSDGNIEKLIPGLIKAGFDALQPLEARAGNDVRVYKPLYGKDVCFFGNISADILAEGRKEKIEEEIRSKLTVAKRGGGYIYHNDHSIPPTVSLENYRFAIECAKKYGKQG